MKTVSAAPLRGFTLIELLAALLILSLLALMSLRGLGAVLDAREHVTLESDKWQRVARFFVRFERDVQLATPRQLRAGPGFVPAWRGRAGTTPEPRLEFSRFAADEDMDAPQRLAYHLNGKQEIELWLWPGLDLSSDVQPVRHLVLTGVSQFDVHYLNRDLAWVAAWPTSPGDAAIPQAVQLHIVLTSGEALVRVFALRS